jgi:hypothetical protein
MATLGMVDVHVIYEDGLCVEYNNWVDGVKKI